MSANLIQPSELSTEKFPYRFLLRWTWPEHIETPLRRLLWTWLAEANEVENPDSSLTRMSDYVAMHVLWLVAVHPESPGAVLDMISRQDSGAYAERVAENPNTWPSTLKRLAAHALPSVRIAVAQNSNTPVDACSSLAADEHLDVRYAMAACPDLDLQTLELLLEDDNCYVAARAKRTIARMFPRQAVQLPARSAGNDSILRKVAEG
jgi:hypothetical protein